MNIGPRAIHSDECGKTDEGSDRELSGQDFLNVERLSGSIYHRPRFEHGIRRAGQGLFAIKAAYTGRRKSHTVVIQA